MKSPFLRRVRFAGRVVWSLVINRPMRTTYWEALGVLSTRKGFSIALEGIPSGVELRVDGRPAEIVVSLAIIDLPTARLLEGPILVALHDDEKPMVYNLDAASELHLADLITAWDTGK